MKDKTSYKNNAIDALIKLRKKLGCTLTKTQKQKISGAIRLVEEI